MRTLIVFATLCLYVQIATPSASGKAQSGFDVLQSLFYTESNGSWATDGWWNNANSLESVCNVGIYLSNNTTAIESVIESVFANQPASIFDTAEYFDDVGWWGLAWLRAYELTNNTQYLARSKKCFNYVATNAWDNTCGGGCWWSQAKGYKNAITNELFLMNSIKLHIASPEGDYYYDWAMRAWNWFEGSGMLNSENLINDGLNVTTCTNNGENTWTYNQGVILGGLANLHTVTGNTTLLEIAGSIANATMTTLVYPSSGVLREACEITANCTSNSEQFKGIFMRYLTYLGNAITETVPSSSSSGLVDVYADFLSTNANWLWKNDNSGSNQFGVYWEGPYASGNAITQTSALDCLTGAAQAKSWV